MTAQHRRRVEEQGGGDRRGGQGAGREGGERGAGAAEQGARCPADALRRRLRRAPPAPAPPRQGRRPASRR
eukprot:738870-Rhodomonas_salina.1